jgi:tryptophan synthase alpha chain
MTSRIKKTFGALKNNGRKAFVAYLTAGDPNLEKTEELAFALESSGVDVLEIGVPFSDPTADGPVIQAASQHALSNGTTLDQILDMIASLRRQSDIPIVLFGYYNPILAYGNERFAVRASDVGVDGILVVDLPLEESDELRRYTDVYELAFISLIAPTTGLERSRKILARAEGFVYYISIAGVTGTLEPQIDAITADLTAIRGVTTLPVVVGFGIASQRQAREIASVADGIVIGSALIRLIHENSGRHNMVGLVSSFASDIRHTLNT